MGGDITALERRLEAYLITVVTQLPRGVGSAAARVAVSLVTLCY